MTDTTAPKPVWNFLQAMTPSLNQCLTVIVTALVTLTGTLVTKRYMDAPPSPSPRIDIVQTQPSSLMARLKALEDRMHDVEKKQAEPPRLPRSPKKQQQG